VDDLPKRGTVRTYTDKDVKTVIRLFQKKSTLSLRQGQAILRRKGLRMSCETIRRYLRAHDIQWRSTIKKPLLSEKHVSARLGTRK